MVDLQFFFLWEPKCLPVNKDKNQLLDTFCNKEYEI